MSKTKKEKLIPLREASTALGITMSALRRKLKCDGHATGLIPVMTSTGVKDTVGVPASVLAAMLARKKEAQRNARAITKVS